MSTQQKPLNVLVIEDNEGDAFLIKFYLGESYSHKFLFNHALNMATAHEFMSKDKFDIILMDLNLPDSNGLDTIKNFIEKYPGSLVIVLTGLIDEQTGLEAVRFGAQDFLVKGKFDSKLLVSSIIFSYERFTLNNRLSKASKDLLKGVERFELLQNIANIGYLELNTKTGIVFASDFMRKHLEIEQNEFPMSYFLENISENNTHILKIYEDMTSSSMQSGEFTYSNQKDNKKALCKWRKLDDLIVGALIYDLS